jgi:hypothetical protein
VLVNFTAQPLACRASGRVEVASDREGEGSGYRGRLAPEQAVVLRE